MTALREEYESKGFITLYFPNELREVMLAQIETCLEELGIESLDRFAARVDTIPDPIWQQKMQRCFRIFSKSIAEQVLAWAHGSFCPPFGKRCSAVNVVLPQEVQDNPHLTEDHLAVYWRCVRAGKPDAGRPHRDASFWDLEFKEGYNPKIPFDFHYLQNCMKIWIPLYGCYPETTLQVIPHSHKMDIPTTVEQTEYGRRPSISSQWLKEHHSLFTSPLELSAGSCILFDMNLVHVGPRHTRLTPRISAEFNFITR
jgi:hypothetical protein